MKTENKEIIIYNLPDGKTKIDVKMEEETVWLTQNQMADLFQSTVANINMHIKNVYDEGVLEEI
jgi:Virulence protein